MASKKARVEVKRITVATQPGKPKLSVGAIVLDNWAVHESLDGPGWRITDLTTGRAIPASMVGEVGMVDAFRIALHIERSIGKAPRINHDVATKTTQRWRRKFQSVIAEVTGEQPRG